MATVTTDLPDEIAVAIEQLRYEMRDAAHEVSEELCGIVESAEEIQGVQLRLIAERLQRLANVIDGANELPLSIDSIAREKAAR